MTYVAISPASGGVIVVITGLLEEVRIYIVSGDNVYAGDIIFNFPPVFVVNCV